MNPAAEARAKVKATHPEAVVVGRGRNSIKHRLADHEDGRQRFALDVAIGPLHYGPANDQEIDTALVPSTVPWDWEMTKAGFEVRALSRLDAGQVIEYRSGSEWVRFQPMALQYSNDLDQIQQIAMPGAVDTSVADDTLTWTDGYGPGRSLSWQAQTARLAKLLTIDSLADLPAVDQFILDGGNSVLELNLIFAHSSGVTPYINGQPWSRGNRSTQSRVEFRDGAGKVLWWFNLPRSWDSEGNEQLGTFWFKKQGNSLYVSHRVPLAFVQGAVYPLMVDVTIDEQVGASLDDVTGDDASWFSDTGSIAYVGQSGGKLYHGSYRFTGVSIEGTIDNAYIQLYPSNELGGTPLRNVYGQDEDNPAAPTSWAEFDADHAAHTTAVAAWDGDWTPATWESSGANSLDSIFQELIDSYTISNAAVMLHVDDDGSANGTYNVIRTYDYDTTLAAKLHIEYTEAGGETRSLAGDQPAATGALARVEQALRALAGSQPTATGILTRIEKAVRALAGAQPAATGTLTYRRTRSLAGSQPAATGTLTRVEKAKRSVAGDQPAPTGALSRIEKAVRALTGSQPAATGTLSYSRTRSLTGDQPNPTGALASVWTGVRALAGSQPTAAGALARVMAAFRAIAGSQPAATGVLSRVEQAVRALAGNQPNPTGTLTRLHRRFVSLAGDQPNALGVLTYETAVTSRSVAGSQPAATGALATFGQFKKSLVGLQPTATGALVRSKRNLRSLAGSQLAAAGVLTYSEIALLPVPDAHAQLAVSIVDAEAVVSEAAVEASAKESVYIPGAQAHRRREG